MANTHHTQRARHRRAELFVFQNPLPYPEDSSPPLSESLLLTPRISYPHAPKTPSVACGWYTWGIRKLHPHLGYDIPLPSEKPLVRNSDMSRQCDINASSEEKKKCFFEFICHLPQTYSIPLNIIILIPWQIFKCLPQICHCLIMLFILIKTPLPLHLWQISGRFKTICHAIPTWLSTLYLQLWQSGRLFKIRRKIHPILIKGPSRARP